ncbi:MAG: DUF4388 domain-containing protein, partial [Acidobacteriota bacterium]
MTCRVFYVDDQEDIVWSATKLLARECPDLVVEGFTDPAEALAALQKSPPDILVTDVRMEGMNGLELMVAARAVIPELPVIVVTAYGGPDVAAALLGRSLVEYLEKPVRAQALIASIDRLLARGEGFSGAISLPMLPDLIQVYTLSQTTGALNIRRRGTTGTIWFDLGKIVHATCGDRSGEEAVYELLSWQGGKFSLDTETRPTETTITVSWQKVLLEGCRRLDEASRDSVRDPIDEEDTSTQVAVPEDFMPRGLATDTAGSDRQANGALPANPSSVASGTGTGPCSVAKQTLADLTTIKGCVGAAVFDGSVSSRPAIEPLDCSIDLEAAVAGNAEVLAAFYNTLS